MKVRLVQSISRSAVVVGGVRCVDGRPGSPYNPEKPPQRRAVGLALCAATLLLSGCFEGYERCLTLSYGSEATGRVAYSITRSGSVPAGAQLQARGRDMGIQHDFYSPNPDLAYVTKGTDGKAVVR